MTLLARQGSPQELIELAHKIKGAARIVQADALATQCEALEQICAHGINPATIEAGVKTTEKSMLELERMLQTQLTSLESR